MKTACIVFARGCSRSMLDAGLLVDYYIKNGWNITSKFREADIVLVCTCGFNIENEDESIKLLSIADRRKKKDSRLIAFGCLPGINDTRLSKEFNITSRSNKNESNGTNKAHDKTKPIGSLQKGKNGCPPGSGFILLIKTNGFNSSH